MSRVTYYATNGRLIAERWCGYDLCAKRRCFGEMSRRNVKRAAKAMLARQVTSDVDDHLDAVLLDIYADAALPDYYPDCSCGCALEMELEWQRFAANQNATVRVPVIPRAA